MATRVASQAQGAPAPRTVAEKDTPPLFVDTGFESQNPFQLNRNAVLELVVINTSDKTCYSPLWGLIPQRIVDLLRVVGHEPFGSRPVIPADSDYGKPLTRPGSMVALFKDGSKITYSFNERSIAASGQTLAGMSLFEDSNLITDPQIYNYFLNYLRKNEYGVSPAWLRTMHPMRIKSIKIDAEDGRTRTLTTTDDDFQTTADSLRWKFVEPNSLRTVAKAELAGGYRVTITFTTGVTYEVRYTKNAIEIASGDMPYRCVYRVKEEENWGFVWEQLLLK